MKMGEKKKKMVENISERACDEYQKIDRRKNLLLWGGG
jgi:hypothetical protein